MIEKKRLDVLLVEKGLEQSRERAKALIMSGIVYVNDQKAESVGQTYPVDVNIEIRGKQHLSQHRCTHGHRTDRKRADNKGIIKHFVAAAQQEQQQQQRYKAGHILHNLKAFAKAVLRFPQHDGKQSRTQRNDRLVGIVSEIHHLCDGGLFFNDL